MARDVLIMPATRSQPLGHLCSLELPLDRSQDPIVRERLADLIKRHCPTDRSVIIANLLIPNS
jgi:hypothetical protein